MALAFLQISLCYDKSEARGTSLSETEKLERGCRKRKSYLSE